VSRQLKAKPKGYLALTPGVKGENEEAGSSQVVSGKRRFLTAARRTEKVPRLGLEGDSSFAAERWRVFRFRESREE
jgi:hypothetical protein